MTIIVQIAEYIHRLTTHMLAVSNGTPLLGHVYGKDTDSNLTAATPLVNTPRQRNFAPPPEVTAMASLTIGHWIDGITHGIDWLTPTNIKIWMDAFANAGVDNTTEPQRVAAAEALESFSSIGGMDADATGTPLSIFENRAINPVGPRQQGNDLNFPQVAIMARDYLQFFVNLAATPANPGAFPETRA